MYSRTPWQIYIYIVCILPAELASGILIPYIGSTRAANAAFPQTGDHSWPYSLCTIEVPGKTLYSLLRRFSTGFQRKVSVPSSLWYVHIHENMYTHVWHPVLTHRIRTEHWENTDTFYVGLLWEMITLGTRMLLRPWTYRHTSSDVKIRTLT